MQVETRQNWSVSDVYITAELDRRTPAKVDYLQEKLALQELAGRMAHSPEKVLPRFVDLAMQMVGGVSGGLSLYEPEPAPGVFRWRYLRGILAPFENTTTPRDFSPCGVTLDRNAPVLSRHPERVYHWIADANIVVPEVLLVPLVIDRGAQLGTLWIVSDKEGHFDSGHARVLSELASFVGIALRMLNSERLLQEALEQQETLTKEMSHRMKNLLTVVAGMVRVSEKGASTPAEMAKMLSGRIQALAQANSLVRRYFVEDARPTPVDLAELVGKIMLPHARHERQDHFAADGPEVVLGERATNGLALVLHELATNAAKYGALNTDGGAVALAWHIEGDMLGVEWSERGGPPVAGAPQTTGFGTRLAHATVVGQFGGTLDYDWRPEGVAVAMKLPLATLRH
jgi:two-component sensor histidine kinase